MWFSVGGLGAAREEGCCLGTYGMEDNWGLPRSGLGSGFPGLRKRSLGLNTGSKGGLQSRPLVRGRRAEVWTPPGLKQKPVALGGS